MELIIAGAILIVLALAAAGLYNGLVAKRNRVEEAWHQISVQLKRRHDLIPNLVSTVRGYMDFEQHTLEAVTSARAAAVAAGAAGPAQSAAAENALSGALRSLFAVVESYPDLKASANVMGLQEELATTENQIGFARQHYNAVVRELNTAVQTFPAVLLARAFGFAAHDYFQIEEADAAAPVVDLGH